MRLVVVGLPQAGKKSIFQLLTGLPVEKAPTRDGMAYAVAPVRDPRIDTLVDLYRPRRVRYAEFEIVLAPHIAPSTSRSAPWMETLRAADAFLHVVRAFDSPSVFHVEGDVDPGRDLELVEMELLLADLDLVEKRQARLAKENSRANPGQEREKSLLDRCRSHLENGLSLRTAAFSNEDQRILRGLNFLTLKPTVAVVNFNEDRPGATPVPEALVSEMEKQGIQPLFLSAAIELEIADLPTEEQREFLEHLDLQEPAAHRLSRAAYHSLGLISFFTVGDDEVRAWPIRNGALAPEAAGRIHSDLARGFIRAEHIAYGELIRFGSEKSAREANSYRLKGKDYLVQDGDILEIRFNV
jgi:ribosome-binding ATPase